VAFVNLDPSNPVTASIQVSGAKPGRMAGHVLTAGAMDAHNSFAQPAAVKPAVFSGARVSGETLEVKMPAKSIVVLSEIVK
jgi:alpha-N-arabinofuranosidase